MAKCDVCGNDYHKTFKISNDAGNFVFDSFECAIHKLAPTCTHCDCKIIGHGFEKDNRYYCCKHCFETI
jgi:hypothetical protein